mgnify:CR=1 FL=1
MLIFYFLIFIFGLIIGSFLNCVIYRIEEGDKLSGRSYCPTCKHDLKWIDLFPVFSYLFLKGKCRYCSKKISIQYPIVEILTGLMFLMVFNHQLSNREVSIFYFLFSIFLFYITSSLIVIFVYDLKHLIIPDKILFPAIIITFLYQLLFNFSFLISNYLWAGLGAFLFFGTIFFMSNGKWMGFGDCKLVFFLGLLLGFPNILLGLFLGFFFGAIIGLVSILLNLSIEGKTKLDLKTQIPFAPFLIAGTIIAMFWGEQIIDWYLNFFLI